MNPKVMKRFWTLATLGCESAEVENRLHPPYIRRGQVVGMANGARTGLIHQRSQAPEAKRIVATPMRDTAPTLKWIKISAVPQSNITEDCRSNLIQNITRATLIAEIRAMATVGMRAEAMPVIPTRAMAKRTPIVRMTSIRCLALSILPLALNAWITVDPLWPSVATGLRRFLENRRRIWHTTAVDGV